MNVGKCSKKLISHNILRFCLSLLTTIREHLSTPPKLVVYRFYVCFVGRRNVSCAFSMKLHSLGVLQISYLVVGVPEIAVSATSFCKAFEWSMLINNNCEEYIKRLLR